MAEQAPGSEVVATRLAEVLFIQALRAHIASGPEHNKGWLRAIFDPQMGTALSAIHDRVNTPWTVESLAVGVASVLGARTATRRNTAIDAYRGLVMLLMMAEVLRFSEIAQAFPTNWFWKILSYNQTHVDWAGCSLHDMIQPSFSFLVGVALPYSIASRLAKGARFSQLLLHAIWRAFLLIALGIFLRSMHQPHTYFTFEDTLTQIGLGYVFLFMLGFAEKERWLWISLGAILFAYWLAWTLYPAAGPGFDWQSVGVPPDWTHHYTGFMAHWNKNANLGNAFDQWFLNLFPRTKPFIANEGGYLTLSFIPTLGTMILGLIAGRWLRYERTSDSISAVAARRSNRCGAGRTFARGRNMPRREAYLDSELDFI